MNENQVPFDNQPLKCEYGYIRDYEKCMQLSSIDRNISW